jgi:hypothetical protein
MNNRKYRMYTLIKCEDYSASNAEIEEYKRLKNILAKYDMNDKLSFSFLQTKVTLDNIDLVAEEVRREFHDIGIF